MRGVSNRYHGMLRVGGRIPDEQKSLLQSMKKKRISDSVRATIFCAYWVIASIVVPVEHAWAYIDPATTTYIIQIAAALVITLGVSLGVFLYKFQMIFTNARVSLQAFWARITKRTQATQEDSANQGSSTQPQALTEEEALAAGVIDCALPARTNFRALADEPASAQKEEQGNTEKSPANRKESSKTWKTWLFEDERPLKKRLIIAALVAFSFAFTFIIFSILDSTIQNEAKMNFSFAEIVVPVLLLGLVVFAVLFVLMAVLRGRVFNLLVCLILAAVVCGWIQSTFFNMSVGKLVGTPLTWDKLGLPAVILNLLLWIALAAFIFYLGFSRKPRVKHFFCQFATYAPALIILVQLVALLSVLPPAEAWNANQSSGTMKTLTTKGFYDVAEKDNVIVFILDMLDQEFIDDILAEDPSYFDDLKGFTRFTNNLSVYNSTFPSVANAMTHVPFDPTVSSEQYLLRAYDQGAFPEDIHKQGYICDMYMEKMYTYVDGSQLEGYVDNIETTTYETDVFKVLNHMTRLSVLKSVPLALKASFSIKSDDFRWLGASELTGGAKPYASNDPEFYNGLKSQGLSVLPGEKRFAYYHLDGSHYPWHMDANAQRVKEETNGVEQTKGCFLILREYFQQLKDLGLYDDATIIITGDHPTHLLYMEPVKPMLVGLFVKPSGESGALQTSAAPVSLANLATTCVDAAGGDGAIWGQGYQDVPENAVLTRDYFNRYTNEDARSHHIAHFEITGDARDWNNWHLKETQSYEDRNWF